MKHATPLMASFVLVVTLLGGYVGAYVGLGTCEDVLDSVTLERYAFERVYSSEWLPLLFKPAADVESLARGERVDTAYRAPE